MIMRPIWISLAIVLVASTTSFAEERAAFPYRLDLATDLVSRLVRLRNSRDLDLLL